MAPARHNQGALSETRGSQVVAVLDAEDGNERADYLRRLACREAGRLVVAITPDTSTLHQLGGDILRALGKRVEISGSSTTANETWFRACAWIAGEGIAEIIVSRAHLLSRLRWERLIELASIADARLWLVCQSANLTRGQRETRRDWQIPLIDFEEFGRRCRPINRRQTKSTSEAKQLPPLLPAEEFPSFLSACRELLGPHDYELVVVEHEASRERFAELLDVHDSSSRPLNDAGILACVEDHLRDCGSLPRLMVRARAAQTTAFLRGYLIKVDAWALAGAYTLTSLSQLDAEAGATLRRYSHPRYPAAAVIALATGAPPRAIAGIDVGDLEADAAAVSVEGREIEIPEAGRGIVRALMALRSAEAATTADPLFSVEKRSARGRTGRVFGRITPAGLHQGLRTVALETGLSVVPPESHGRDDPGRRLRRQGITVSRLVARRRAH